MDNRWMDGWMDGPDVAAIYLHTSSCVRERRPTNKNAMATTQRNGICISLPCMYRRVASLPADQHLLNT